MRLLIEGIGPILARIEQLVYLVAMYMVAL